MAIFNNAASIFHMGGTGAGGGGGDIPLFADQPLLGWDAGAEFIYNGLIYTFPAGGLVADTAALDALILSGDVVPLPDLTPVNDSITAVESRTVYSVLDRAQLNDPLGVLRAISLGVEILPLDGDTMSLRRGATVEIFTFKNTPAGAFDIQIEGTLTAQRDTIVTAINTDSVIMTATPELNESWGTPTFANPERGFILMVAKSDLDTASINTAFVTPSSMYFLSFGTSYDYGSSISNPTVSGYTDTIAENLDRFGPGITLLELQNGFDNRQFAVDDPEELWTWDNYEYKFVQYTGAAMFSKEVNRIKGAVKGTVNGDRFADSLDGINFLNTPELIEWPGKLIRIAIVSENAASYEAHIYKNGASIASLTATAESKKISGALSIAVTTLDEIQLKFENVTIAADNPRIIATFKED